MEYLQRVSNVLQLFAINHTDRLELVMAILYIIRREDKTKKIKCFNKNYYLKVVTTILVLELNSNTYNNTANLKEIIFKGNRMAQ